MIAAGSGVAAHRGGVLTGLQKFDDFGDIKCEEEMARLDNVAIHMQNEPNTKAVLVFFGGTAFHRKLPRDGEAAARAARLKPYLVNRRGIAFNRVMVFDGGYADNWHVEVWLVPVDFWFPPPTPKMPEGGVKLRKGTASPREFRCGV
jgi:hypothetical protein